MHISFRSIILLLIVLAASVGVSYAWHKSELDSALHTKVAITPDNVVAVNDISEGDVVEIKGTPDLLNAVSMEDRDSGEVLTYYVPLKEYGTNFVVQIDKAKLRTEEQTFTGIAIGITHTNLENRIRNRLNKPIELNDSDRADLDADTIQALTNQTTNEFTAKTLMIQDGQIPDASGIYATIAFWGVLIFLALSTLLRKLIFA